MSWDRAVRSIVVPAILGLLASGRLLLAQEESGPPPQEAAPEAEEAALPEGAGESPRLPDYEEPAPRYKEWLKQVDLLILGPERLAFHKLRTNYQRDAFIQKFWESRDPFPETARNELKDRFTRFLYLAKSRYGTLDDDRSRILLIHGEPTHSMEVRCTNTFKPAEVWAYQRSSAVGFPFVLVFFNPRNGGASRVWRPGNLADDHTITQIERCINGDQFLAVVGIIRQSGDYDLTLQRVLAKPRPRSSEWLSTFVSFTTDVPPDAELFRADLSLEFLGRYQSRTVTQGVLRIPRFEIETGELAGYRSYDLLLTGEVVSEDRLFESFRYKFGFPLLSLRQDEAEFPLAFQRFLRPGAYTLVVKLEDLNSGRYYRRRVDISVPQMDEVVATPPSVDPESASLFAEATAAVRGATSIRLVPPRSDLLTGFVRFDTLAVGDEIQRVAFSLDGRQLMIKNRPPFNVEIDLGPFPRLHNLEVEAFDGEGERVAHDQLLINSGSNRFRVVLQEPQKGRHYERSLLAKAQVETPDDRTLERVEFYLNDDLLATLYQPPYVQPITLPGGDDLTFVRAVAYLADGNSTEDLVFVNAPEYLEEVDVRFVELYATVLDSSGRPVRGLTEEEFVVRESGVRQKLTRFDEVGDLPIHVGILLDNSGSMRGALDAARAAAIRFFQQVITPKDRAAVITFNRFPTLAVKLTNDLVELGGGLAGLTPEGETSLYDSVMFGLYYFTGIKGQRALLLLSDGRDEGSRFSFQETLEYARRAGVTLYSIGLQLRDGAARSDLRQLADDTGGRSFFIENVDELPKIYDLIQQELRSQYLLAFQSSNRAEDETFRPLEVGTSRKDLEVKTISGYYP
ncbi:MAG: VWA domain-containing protein [Acidobacteria bacterium]|nr:VWA domain-containing protein [Acidobacteriota bacterium]